jgi:hypothetical protein
MKERKKKGRGKQDKDRGACLFCLATVETVGNKGSVLFIIATVPSLIRLGRYEV